LAKLSQSPGDIDVEIKIKRLSHAEGLPLPAYQSAGAAGLDLVAAVPVDAPLALLPGGRMLVPTGLVMEIGAGFEAQVRPRSGLALKYGVTVLNSPGTIDSDYRGEVSVILINHGEKAFQITRGDRIAQLVVAPAPQARLIPAEDVATSRRGAGGFGSTGEKIGSK
jgi:dUTP pyrophosphatase